MEQIGRIKLGYQDRTLELTQELKPSCDNIMSINSYQYYNNELYIYRQWSW